MTDSKLLAHRWLDRARFAYYDDEPGWWGQWFPVLGIRANWELRPLVREGLLVRKWRPIITLFEWQYQYVPPKEDDAYHAEQREWLEHIRWQREMHYKLD